METWTNRYKSIEKVVGGGYYALRKTKYGSKLVKADRGPGNHVFFTGTREPSVGHNPRRQAILDKRAA